MPWSSRERQLLDAVLQRPLDDGPRQVLIDHWLETDDVRGEFGALSFAPPTSRIARERRHALMRQHGRAWVGPLQPAISVSAAQFPRGPFVSRAVVSFRDEAASLQTRNVDEWALLEAIRFVGERQDFNANMRGLREVTGVNTSGLRSLLRAQLPRTIEVLGVTEGIDDEVWSDDELWSTSLANVRTLIIEDLGVAVGPELTEPRMFPQLRTLEVWFRSELGQFERWRDQRAFECFSRLCPLLRPGLTFSAGYQLQNGARAGVVASTTIGSGEIRFEDRRFASEAEHQRARHCFDSKARAAFSDARPTPSVVVTPAPSAKKPGLVGRLLSIFRPPR